MFDGRYQSYTIRKSVILKRRTRARPSDVAYLIFKTSRVVRTDPRLLFRLFIIIMIFFNRISESMVDTVAGWNRNFAPQKPVCPAVVLCCRCPRSFAAESVESCHDATCVSFTARLGIAFQKTIDPPRRRANFADRPGAPTPAKRVFEKTGGSE